jgi:FkbM family methyltransferase
MESFLHKSWREKLTTAEFFVRRSLAKLPYLPVPVHLQISQEEEIDLWWSYVVPFVDTQRRFFDYWGHDLGDLRFLWKVLKPGMVFFDIGAYHGIYSLVAGRRLGAGGRIVAFEPSPRECRRLRLHLRWNGISSTSVEPCAVGSANGDGTFFQVVSGDTSRNGLRPPDSKDSVVKIPVKTIGLDQYITDSRLQHVDVVKLDVEGGEMAVLQGAERVLTEVRPIFICELLDATTRVWGYDARELVLTMQRYDFEWFEVQSSGALVPHKVQDCYPEVRNYVAVPRERRREEIFL